MFIKNGRQNKTEIEYEREPPLKSNFCLRS